MLYNWKSLGGGEISGSEMLAIQACVPESHPQNLCRSLDKTRASTSSAETIERDKLKPMSKLQVSERPDFKIK